MAFIQFGNNYPGIMAPAWYKPGSGKAMFELTLTNMSPPRDRDTGATGGGVGRQAQEEAIDWPLR